MTSDVPLLDVQDLTVSYEAAGGLRRARKGVQAVRGVSFGVSMNETVGVVGESGCGKSTIARTIVGLERSQAGSVQFDGTDLPELRKAQPRRAVREIQLIAQDPYSFLNPRMTVRQLVTEPWKVHPEIVDRSRWEDEFNALLDRVDISRRFADRLPRQLSGGQRQRVCIARALALRPRLLVCDEPVSALDVSVQAQILNLLVQLREELDLACLFISHDLAVVGHVCDRVVVIYLGKVMEIGTRDDVFSRPSHPYTQALLSAAPVAQPWESHRQKEIVLHGDIPSPIDIPSGCPFRTRCWKAQDICRSLDPALTDRGQGHPVACHFAEVDAGVMPS